MAESNSPRLGLRRWSAPTDTFSRAELDTTHGQLEALVMIYREGTLAARPSPSVAGTFYFVKDDPTAANNGQMFYANGVSWTSIGRYTQDGVTRASSSGVVAQAFVAASGQTANIVEWRNSSGSVLSYVTASGGGVFATLRSLATLVVDGVATFSNDINVSGRVNAARGTFSDIVTISKLQSTALRADGTPKFDLRGDGTAFGLAGIWEPGDIKKTARSGAVGAGWLECNGQEVSRTTYADLFLAIGTTHGAGNGSTTFNVPNYEEYVLIGQSSARPLGTKGGAKEATLTVTNLPAHDHGINHDHASFTSGNSGTHIHTTTWREDAGGFGPQNNIAAAGTGSGTVVTKTSAQSAGDHTHTIDVPEYVGTSGSTGGGQPVNIEQRWASVRILIKT